MSRTPIFTRSLNAGIYCIVLLELPSLMFDIRDQNTRQLLI